MIEIIEDIKNSHHRKNISINDNINLEFVVKIDTIYSEEYNLFKVILATTTFIQGLNIGRKYKIIIKQPIEVYDKDIFKVNFDNCIFKENISFIDCSFLSDVSFINCEFKKKLNLYNSEFKENVRFHSSVFHKFSVFQNTTFNKLVDFYKATFKNNQQFHLTDFLDRAIFSNVTFEKQIQFLYNKVKPTTMISFENTEFNEALDISRANFKCQLHFWNTKINNIPNYCWLYNSDDIYKEEINNTIAYTRMRESFRIIKSELKISGNSINALVFHKKEMQVYRKELNESKHSNLSDKIILKFNKYSNNHGTRWDKGVLFTIIPKLSDSQKNKFSYYTKLTISL